MEGFYVGLLHPLSTPPQLLALLAIGLMLGQRFPLDFKRCWTVFAAFNLGGIVLGQLGILEGMVDAGLLTISLIAASLAALLPHGVMAACILLVGCGGLLLGVVSTPEPGPLQATVITLVGCFVGANLALLYASGGFGWLKERFAQPWARIGLRILAAWIAAISCLMLALVVSSSQEEKVKQGFLGQRDIPSDRLVDSLIEAEQATPRTVGLRPGLGGVKNAKSSLRKSASGLPPSAVIPAASVSFTPNS